MLPTKKRPARAVDAEVKRLLGRLRHPEDIQRLLDATPYSIDPIYRAPLRVLRDRRAHCVDGALLAAHALRALGQRPLVVDLRAERDDDHVIALFRVGKHLGAVAKSNVVALRYREPVYRSLRELVMSYFDWYYNTSGERALRSYSVPVDLARFDRDDWVTRDETAEAIVAALDRARHIPLLTKAMVRALRPVDERTYRAGLLGADPAGLYAADQLKIALR